MERGGGQLNLAADVGGFAPLAKHFPQGGTGIFDQFLKDVAQLLIAPEPREQAIIAHGNFVGLPDDEKRMYENRVVTFFLLHLPATGTVFH